MNLQVCHIPALHLQFQPFLHCYYYVIYHHHPYGRNKNGNRKKNKGTYPAHILFFVFGTDVGKKLNCDIVKYFMLIAWVKLIDQLTGFAPVS